MDNYRDMRARAWALDAAARSTVNPGHVIRIATRYAYFIEHGTDPGEHMQNAAAVGPVEDVGACPECGHPKDQHRIGGCTDVQKDGVFLKCRCSLPNGRCDVIRCRDHNHG